MKVIESMPEQQTCKFLTQLFSEEILLLKRFWVYGKILLEVRHVYRLYTDCSHSKIVGLFVNPNSLNINPCP